MRRIVFLSVATVLMLSQGLLAQQHHGRHGAGAPASGQDSSPDDLTDFKRAIALQATPDQVSRFRVSAKSLEVARESVKRLQSGDRKIAEMEDLSFAVTDAQTNNAKFLASFSEAQRSGLKEYIRKITKANGELNKQSKTLGGSKYEPAAVEKIDHALAEMQSNQLAICTEMGITSAEKRQ